MVRVLSSSLDSQLDDERALALTVLPSLGNLIFQASKSSNSFVFLFSLRGEKTLLVFVLHCNHTIAFINQSNALPRPFTYRHERPHDEPEPRARTRNRLTRWSKQCLPKTWHLPCTRPAVPPSSREPATAQRQLPSAAAILAPGLQPHASSPTTSSIQSRTPLSSLSPHREGLPPLDPPRRLRRPLHAARPPRHVRHPEVLALRVPLGPPLFPHDVGSGLGVLVRIA